jgi:hypothetical protein
MLTLARAKLSEGTLLTLFMGFSDSLCKMYQQRIKGKKILERILDMSIEKRTLVKSLEDIINESHRDVYNETISIIEQTMINEVCNLC